MSWIALILTLLLEQVRATPSGNPVYAGAAAWADKVARNLNAGKARHGCYGWLLVVGLGVLLTLVLFELARSWFWLPALAVDVAVLFFALGFRQFSHPITAIQTALEQGDPEGARRRFTQWRRATDPQFDPTELSEAEIARQSIEFGLLASHRHVFGVLFWFLVLPGPSGAVLYRLSEYLARHWNRPPALVEATLCRPDVPLRAAQTELIQSKTGFLLLQDEADRKLAGILTLHDILRAGQAASEQGQV